MSANLRYVPVAPESALASTGSGDPDGLDNADDAVPTDFFFNAPFALELFSLGGENFVTALAKLQFGDSELLLL
jgi:hypothetical protein